MTLPQHKKENKQASLISNAIKRKSDPKKSALNTLSTESTRETDKKRSKEDETSDNDNDSSGDESSKKAKSSKTDFILPSAKIVIGVLPGLGEYNSSDSSDESSSDDDDDDESFEVIHQREVRKEEA
jgi:hypothetical protein